MPRGRRAARALFAGITVLHAAAALYLSLLHQSGPGAVLSFLAAEAAAGRVGAGGILLLTPCHETPGYSHLHARVPMRLLECSPRADGRATQRDAFFAAPAAGLLALLDAYDASTDAAGVAWADRVGDVPLPEGAPSHLVLFDDIEPPLRPLLAARGYALRLSAFHAHFAVDRDQKRLLVYALGDRLGGGASGQAP